MEQKSLPEDVDPRLWFRVASCEGLHYLIDSNPHTFRGRMHAYCSTDELYTRVSKESIVESSDEARYFVRGYLAGSEPPPPEDENGPPLKSTDPRMLAWFRDVEEFRETGFWDSSRG